MAKLDRVMESMITIIEREREKGPIDVQLLFVKMTLDAIGVVAFDSNLGGLDGSRDVHALLLQAGYMTRERLLNPLKKAYTKYFSNSKLSKRQNAIIDGLTAEWDRLTKEILERDDPPDGEEPMWHVLRNLKDPETNETIPYKSLLCEVATVVLGGMVPLNISKVLKFERMKFRILRLTSWAGSLLFSERTLMLFRNCWRNSHSMDCTVPMQRKSRLKILGS